MLELREDLAFAPKTANQLFIAERRGNDLDRHLLLERIVGARGEVHGTHTAVSELALYLIRAETASSPADRGRRQFGRRPAKKAVAGPIVCLEERLHPGACRRVRAIREQEAGAFGRRQFECLVEERTIGRGRIHGGTALYCWGSSPKGSRVPEQTLSHLISRARAGDTAAESELTAAVYPELRRLARRYLSSERKGHTLQTTELIHEAWLRLFGANTVSVQDRNHLVALMATQMRRALVDYARHRNAAKGPGAAVRVSLSATDGVLSGPDEDLLAIDDALTALEAVDARASRVVELRFFAGLLEAEAADALGISVSTLKRDWAFARAWLYNRLGQ